MTSEEQSFLSQCKTLGKKEKVKLVTALRRMMEMDTEGTFYGVDDNLTSAGLLIKDFIKILRKREVKTDENIS